MHYLNLVVIIVCLTVTGVQTQQYRRQQPTGQLNPVIWSFYSKYADIDQHLDADRLSKVLTSLGISGSYKTFKGTGRLIALFDRNRDGKIEREEFKEMWAVLNQWKTLFNQYDQDNSGTIEPHELQAALTSFGYRLSPQALGTIVKAAAENGSITFDNFFGLCMGLHSLTEQFKRRDARLTGKATFQYDDFIQVVFFSMPLN